MSELMNELEDILKRYLSSEERDGLDLADDDCFYRKFYFDKVPEDAAKEALLLFPNGEALHQKYQEIRFGLGHKKVISDDELCVLTGEYLRAAVSIMEEDEDRDAISFINSVTDILAADKLEVFAPGNNLLHKFAYGAIGEFLLNDLPDDDALWLLYDWSLEKTKWITVPAYFLEDFIDESLLPQKNLFRPGFDMWLTRNSNHYWADGNTFKGTKVLCKAAY